MQAYPLRDAQILARHADPRTTEHYDRARGNLDRHGVLILDSQRIASHRLSSLVRKIDSTLAAKWERRRETYEMLLTETRDLRGLLGTGAAAGQAAIVAARAQRLTVHSEASTETLQQADRLFHRIDARLTQVIVRTAIVLLLRERRSVPRQTQRHGSSGSQPAAGLATRAMGGDQASRGARLRVALVRRAASIPPQAPS